jgi:LmbE family N-acetylglucosaminyl deacetylase
VRWIGIEDGTVAANEDGLVAVIERMLGELCPDELYATSADEPHPDHAAVGRAARRAATSVPRVSVLEYPIWLWGAWPLRPGHRLGSMVEAAGRVFRHSAVTVRTDGIVDAKLHALDAHQTQMRRLAEIPDDEEWIVLPKQVLAAASDTVELFFPFAQ